jgi:hypothetical protein
VVFDFYITKLNVKWGDCASPHVLFPELLGTFR